MVGPEPTALPLGYSPILHLKKRFEKLLYPSEKVVSGQEIRLPLEVATNGYRTRYHPKEHPEGE